MCAPSNAPNRTADQSPANIQYMSLLEMLLRGRGSKSAPGSVIVSTSFAVRYEGGASVRREVVSETDALRDVDMRRGVRGRIPDSVVNRVGVADVEPLFWPAR